MKREVKNKYENLFWADNVADEIIKREKKVYVCEAGITPSGTIHFGNFREIITTELVERALKDKGKKTRFIYSWDDYDRFRKIPKGIDKEWERYIGMPVIQVPDPFGRHKSYAEHFEKEMEESLVQVGIKPEFISQAKKYMKGDYAKQIRDVMKAREKIRDILNKYRTHNLEKSWWPIIVYCEKCKKDYTEVKEYDEEYSITYKCSCGHKDTIDFRKKSIVKLQWRVDWPMRWSYNKVDFEPAGKDHFASGGSRDSAVEIQKEVWKDEPPFGFMYEWIRIKGGSQFSSSEGVTVTLKEALEVYEPAIIRWMFAGTRPSSEFALSFDLDVLKIYEDFDKCERIFFKRQETSEKEYLQKKRIYELSCVNAIPKKMPFQPSFRHLTNVIQIYEGDLDKVKQHYKKELKSKEDKKRLELRAKCALNWIEKYAPVDFRFEVQEKISEKIKLSEKQKKALHEIADALEKKEFNEKTLFEEFYRICKKIKIEPAEFFKAGYLVLLNKEKGPRLANFILTLGKEKVINMFRQA